MANYTSDDITAIGEYIINRTTPDVGWRELADQSPSWPYTNGQKIPLETLKEWGKTHRWFQKRAQAFADRNPEHINHLQVVYNIMFHKIASEGTDMGGGQLAQLSKMLLEYQNSISKMLPKEDGDDGPEFVTPDVAKDIIRNEFDGMGSEILDGDALANMLFEETPGA